MAKKKFTQLPAAGTLTGPEIVAVVQGGESVQTTVQAIADLGGSGSGDVTYTDLKTSRTFTSSDDLDQNDQFKVVYTDSASPVNITVDLLDAGTQISIINKGSATATLIEGAGVTLVGTTIDIPAGQQAVIIYKDPANPDVYLASGGWGTSTDPSGVLTVPMLIDGDQPVIFGGTTQSVAEFGAYASGPINLNSADEDINLVTGGGAGGSLVIQTGDVKLGTDPGTAGEVFTSNGPGVPPTWEPGGGGSGTVTSVSVTTANGVSGSVATATTTPAISLTLGAITPSSVNGISLTGSASPNLTVVGSSAISGSHSGTSSGTNTGDNTFGTGVQTALAVNVGSAGSVVVNGGALGTPSSGTATNLTGTASGLTAGTVTTNANLTGDVTSTGNATAIASGVIVNADVNASAAIDGTKLANTPAGGIAATTVQAAINELDTEKANLINAAVTLTDASSIALTAIKHSLASSSSTRTFTITYTGDDITMEVTLSNTAATYTFPSSALCVSEGVASGDNTLSIAGVSGDKYIITTKKIGSAYYVVSKNFGQ